MIDWIPAPTLGEALLPAPVSAPADDAPLERFEYMGSGKAAIAAALVFLRETGVLPDKMAPVLVPKWLGYPVYQTMLEQAFPTTEPASGAKVLLAYHQYGFPQDMTRVLEYADFHKLVLIEDCAHAFDSELRGRRLGTFGDFAVFSYSKFAFCGALGGIASKSEAFADMLDRRMAAAPSVLPRLIDVFRRADEWNLARETPFAAGPMTRIRKALFAVYGDSPLPLSGSLRRWLSRRADERAARRANLAQILDAFAGTELCAGLEREGVTPFVVPLFVPDARVDAVVRALASIGVRTGGYWFDVKRFVVEPEFKRCVPLPCHSQVTANDVARMAEAVRSAL